MDGNEDRRFSPHLSTTRGMIVTILWRMEGRPRAVGGLTFPDVDPGGYCAGAVAWAHETGLVLGYDNGLYGPNDPITREQLALILQRCHSDKGVDFTHGHSLYPDVDTVSTWAEDAMAWAISAKLIQGSESGALMPQGRASRAEVAAIIQRFLALP